MTSNWNYLFCSRISGLNNKALIRWKHFLINETHFLGRRNCFVENWKNSLNLCFREKLGLIDKMTASES